MKQFCDLLYDTGILYGDVEFKIRHSWDETPLDTSYYSNFVFDRRKLNPILIPLKRYYQE